MANRTYLVELTPLGNYYFGSENTFNSTDKAGNDAVSTNYLVRSRAYPQQTALLGLMRYALLLKEGALQKNSAEKKAIIGEKSFQGIENNAPTDWGQIQSISPLFIKKGASRYIVAGQDCQFYDQPRGLTHLVPKEKPASTSSFSKDGYAYLPDYDPKQYSKILWKNIQDAKDVLKPDDIFKEVFQVGITKSFWGKSENDAFYKQYFYTLKEGFSFALYITTKEDIKDFNIPIISPFGADQSLFQIKFLAENDAVFAEKPEPKNKSKITLLSDAYCQPEILDHCFLAITNEVDFRYIKTHVDTKRYYNMSKKPDDMQKSAKLNLLERGSVLYTDQPSEITEVLKKSIAYRNVGFNYYSIESLS
jgi:CRISPR-associated protein Cmr3